MLLKDHNYWGDNTFMLWFPSSKINEDTRPRPHESCNYRW